MGESRGHDGPTGITDGDSGDGAEFRYRGNRLDRPETGPGSVPGFGRRLVAVTIDWLLALCLSSLLFGVPSFSAAGGAVASGAAGWLPLLVFAAMTTVLLILFGTTVGKRLVGVRIAATGERALPWPAAMVLRTVLLCLVLPAVVYDRDQRGLHDRAAGTVNQRL
ncbi:RDD family protein [Thermobifida halotolerans]|uniref:RDD family protein n=1 Tax=Thermobifida halotolerans TaxID=483545 RepID=A0AA97LY30_9ACTN|nr:RDD family protein [Thermobifida halotolerans]UOE20106.1 RDD family protein [Thermobifida halotolerans]